MAMFCRTFLPTTILQSNMIHYWECVDENFVQPPTRLGIKLRFPEINRGQNNELGATAWWSSTIVVLLYKT
eukprot:scaffold2422_cov171-Amphora_coffeaeformis.AAC.3